MALSAGTRLGPYEILEPLGAGGMGEVYRATDNKLGREVAIKTLLPEVAEDPGRLARFRHEAHLLAALNHPNIAAIYGLEESDGQPFLVLELVEGEDLRQRLKRGAIPVNEALEIAKQIAEGLEAAHEKGIVHRDLKPANVKLTPDGKVKVLDFGIAKAWASDSVTGSSSDLSQSDTLTRSGSRGGVILGTAAYMSPEQARSGIFGTAPYMSPEQVLGKPVDKRADIWASGVVLFEMLTGRRVFTGETVPDTLAAVLSRDPQWTALPPGTPRVVRRLLARCLRKDPRTRLPDIGAARLDLQDVLGGTAAEMDAGEDTEAVATAERRRRTRQRWAWAAAGLVIAGQAAFLAVTHLTKGPEPLAVHFVPDTPEGLSLREFGDMPVPSPDGRHLAFTAWLGGTRQLWIRPLDSPEARPLPGTEGARFAFWSPDSAWIAFFTGSDLSKVRFAGGGVHRICARPRGAVVGGTWGDGGTIVFSSGGGGDLRAGLFSVAAGGGEARPLTTPDESRGETALWWPQFLPDGRRFLFVVGSTQDQTEGLHVASLNAPDERRRLLPGNARVVHSSGHLLFVRDATLLAQPFDTGGLEVSGEPAPVVQGVDSWISNPSWGYFGVSPSGVLAYHEGRASDVQLVWLDRKGERLGTVGEPGPYGQIALSSDGRRVAFEVVDDERVDLWVMNVSRGVASLVTADPAGETDPVWSPDGQDLVFASGAAGTPDLFRKGLRGGTPAAPLLESPEDLWPEDWSRDGKTLLYIAGDASIWALPLAGDGPPELVLKTGLRLDEAQLSPDGRWLAYISDESGEWEVYVQPFRRPGERLRVSVDGGGQPKWRGDGKELFYRSASGPLVAVEVSEGADGLEVGPPTELFDVGVVRRPQVDDYAVADNGQRFLVKVPVGEGARDRMHVVTDWPSLLE